MSSSPEGLRGAHRAHTQGELLWRGAPTAREPKGCAGEGEGSRLSPYHPEKTADTLGVLCPKHMPHSADLAARRPEPLPVQA